MFSIKKKKEAYPFGDIIKNIVNNGSAEDKDRVVALVLYFKDDKDMVEALKNLERDTLEQLMFEMCRRDSVSVDFLEETKNWLDKESKKLKNQVNCGIEISRDILEKSIGAQRTIDIVNSLTSSIQITPFDFIKKSDTKHLANVLKQEMNQTIAVVCAYIGEEQAAKFLSYIEEERKYDILIKIAKMQRISPDILREIERVIERKLSTLASEDFTNSGGVDYLAKILSQATKISKNIVLDEIEGLNPELAEDLKSRLG